MQKVALVPSGFKIFNLYIAVLKQQALALLNVLFKMIFCDFPDYKVLL